MSVPQRFIGLDVHKHYAVAVGVDEHGTSVLGPARLEWSGLTPWIEQQLTRTDAIAFEMTGNALGLYDELLPHVHSVTIVHPAHVTLITRDPVKTDRKAALALARLHAAGLLEGIWVPPPAVREQRALVAQRSKMVRLSTQAKNRLHALLQRLRLAPPQGSPFDSTQRDWWLQLPLSAAERVRVECDLDTLRFAQQQIAHLTESLTAWIAHDERAPWLLQLPGFSIVVTATVLSAIGCIERFPSARHLVGYAGFGTRVHDSGELHTSGRITKAGRAELRHVLIEAAQVAARTHPHWRAERARLEARLGYNKTMVAIARKLLVAVWHVLSHQTADRFAEPERVARKFMQHAYRLGRAQRPDAQPVTAYIRTQLDQLGLGRELTSVRMNAERVLRLPPSQLQHDVA